MVWALKFGPYGEQLALAWKEGQVSGGGVGLQHKNWCGKGEPFTCLHAFKGAEYYVNE